MHLPEQTCSLQFVSHGFCICGMMVMLTLEGDGHPYIMWEAGETSLTPIICRLWNHPHGHYQRVVLLLCHTAYEET